MKDEMNGRQITECAAIRSEMYAFIVENMDQFKKVKGVRTNVVENSINFQHFLGCLFHNKQEIREQRRICSKYHNIYTRKEKKLALSPFDDKRCLIENSTDTYAWGHKNLEN